MKFQVPVELARLYPRLTPQDMADIKVHISSILSVEPDMEYKEICRIAFQNFLTDKGISY